MSNKEIEESDFYNINPESLEDSFLDIPKVFFGAARATANAYHEQLLAKSALKKASAQSFINTKNRKDTKITDGLAKEMIEVDPQVLKKQEVYFKALNAYERCKSLKETILIKKEALIAIGYNRKLEVDLEKER